MLIVDTIMGALGAVVRYLLSGWAQRASRSDFPIGTLTVNLAGAFLVGTVALSGDLESVLVVASMGFLGGFTTFSTWMTETLRLGPVSVTSVLNLFVTLIGGVAVAAIGNILAT